MTLKPKLKYLVATAAGSVVLAAPHWNDSRADSADTRSLGGPGKGGISIVLYEGPLVHDQNWILKAGPPGPENQKFQPLGGSCSMIPGDIHNVAAFERVTFEAERQDLGLWKMAWTDTVAGTASDGNDYTYRQRHEFTAPTNDGKPPRPNRATPSPGNSDGFLQVVPNNVNADATDEIDFFILQSPGAGVVANSHFHLTFRLQIPPAETDPPPDFFPIVFQGKYIANTINQLAGQRGCDPL